MPTVTLALSPRVLLWYAKRIPERVSAPEKLLTIPADTHSARVCVAAFSSFVPWQRAYGPTWSAHLRILTQQ